MTQWFSSQRRLSRETALVPTVSFGGYELGGGMAAEPIQRAVQSQAMNPGFWPNKARSIWSVSSVWSIWFFG